MSEWISVNDRLPDVHSGYFLTARYYHSNKETYSVQESFYIKDRAFARKVRKGYSRKLQGKNSVHFNSCEGGFIITHWMPLPEQPKGE